MIAEIISVGTEIIIGSILNTNTKYLSSKLMEMGIETFYHTSVDDNEERLTKVIDIALGRADIIITTGGLGPTQDDLTKEVIAKALNLELEMDLVMEQHICNMFTSMNRTMSDSNRKQAIKPKGAEFITNEIGTAPGIYINKDNKKIIMLPGPPREMNIMFENHVVPLLDVDFSIVTKSINTIGVGESDLETGLRKLNIFENGIEIATFAKEGEVEIKIIGKGQNKEYVEENINFIIERIKSKFGDYIYGYNNIPIEEVVINLLKEKNFKIGLCESCTGGLITSRITKIPGASNVLDRAIISYSNESKIEELNVKKETLESFGAVSEETAYEMAKGLLEKSNLDILLSITGIAGPTGGTTEKPVGLVYICIMSSQSYKVIKCLFNGNRNAIQNKASTRALAEIWRFLSK